MNVARLETLVVTWREEAELLRRRGQEPLARMAESFAGDLERELRAWLTEELTLAEAAQETGYSYDHLQHMVGDAIPNVGADGSPRVRRCDLPRKPGRNGTLRPAEGDLADVALAARLTR